MANEYFMIVLMALSLAVFGCASESSNNPQTDGDTLADGDQPDGDSAADGDDPIIPDGDREPCDGVCLEAEGYYCDPAAGICRSVSCTPCLPEYSQYHCGSKTCALPEDDWNTQAICMKRCSPGVCDEGTTCIDGLCRPLARCSDDSPQHPASLPGGPCEFGTIWKGYGCHAGHECIGNEKAQLTYNNITCRTTLDCTRSVPNDPAVWCEDGACQTYLGCESKADCEAVFDAMGYCAVGFCGFSGCAVPCLASGECPTIAEFNEPLYPATVSGKCYCAPETLFPPPVDGDEDPPVDGDLDGDVDIENDADGDVDGDADALTDGDAEGEADSEAESSIDADTDPQIDGDADPDPETEAENTRTR